MTTKLAKFFSKLLSRIIWLASIFLILFVLLLSIFKVSLPYWLGQKDSITNYVESYFGGKLDYQSLQVDWTEFHPTVLINDLTWVNDSKSVSVNSGKNKIQLNLWKTIYYGDLVSEDIEVSGLDIAISTLNYEPANSDVSIEKIKKNILTTLKRFRHKYIAITNFNLRFIGDNRITQQVPLLIYKQNKTERQLVFDTMGELIESGRFVIESKGEPLAKGSHIDYFADLKRANLELLARQFEIKNIADFNTIDLKGWLKQKSEIIEKGRLEISNEKSQAAHLDLKVNLINMAGRYQINSETFKISVLNNNLYETHDSFIKFSDSENGSDYRVQTGVMPIGFVSKLVLPFVKGDAAEYLVNLHPSGVINQLDLLLVEKDDYLIPSRGHLKLENLKLSAFKGVPGLHLAQAELSGRDGKWLMSAHSSKFLLDWRPMLKEITSVESLEFVAGYDVNRSKEINIERLYFKNNDAIVKARASLSLDNEIAMAIYAEAEDVDISKLHYYWPRYPGLKPKTLDYLDSSLLGGRVPFAKFIWQGASKGFPFKDNDGQFDIKAQVKNATFKFQPDWPKATNLFATASFENEKIIINSHKGELLGAKIITASAILPDLEAKDNQLLITAKAETSYDSYKNIYLNSPLKDMLGDDLIEINFDNMLETELQLAFVLADKVEAKVNGLINFTNNTISGIPYNIELTDTQGVLKFTENGAISEQLSVKYLGNPLIVDVKVEDYTDNDSLVQVDAQGFVDVGAASEQLLGFSPLNIEGKSLFNIHYEVDKQEDATESLIVRSDLLGTKIEGPNWLSKSVEEEAEFLTTLLKLNDQLNVRSLYKDQFSTQLNVIPDYPEEISGLIRLGDLATQTFEMPEQGVAIEGYFDSIKVHEWLNAFKSNDDGEHAWPKWINRINVTTPSLVFAGQEFTKVRINDLGSLDQELHFNLYSEQARANIAFYANGQKKLIIENLDVHLKPFITENSETIQVSLQEYDNWLFECQLCKINDYEFGPVSLSSNFDGENILLQGDAYVSDQLSINISGSISGISTGVTLDFSVPSPDGLLKYWQLEGDVRDTETQGQLNLNWPGRLHDFSLNKTNGHFKMETGRGSIKDLSDRKARIFSLFSLQSIPRRLSLDFTDIFRDGFFYDQIVGNFSIKNGVLVSDKVEVKGTAADVAVTGTVDLNTQMVSQNVTVTPKLGSSLPVLAGWAIEPTTGLIMLIVSKIFEPALNVVSSIEYKISGPLDNPNVEEISKKSKEITVSDEQIEAQKKLLEESSNEQEIEH